MKPIPQEWIKNYVDQLCRAAQLFEKNTTMHTAPLVRADAVMDMVKAFQDDSCEHEYLHDRHRYVYGDMCVKCGKLRPTESSG